jgi:hypothetical protein
MSSDQNIVIQSSTFQGYLEPGQARVVAASLLRRQKGTRFSTIAIGTGVGCLMLGVVQIARSNNSGAAQWIILGLVVGLIGAGLRISEWRAVTRSLATQEIKGSVEAEGVRLINPRSETLFRWSSFHRSEEKGSVVVLWLTEGQALALAEHMFAAPGGFDWLVSQVRAQVRAS